MPSQKYIETWDRKKKKWIRKDVSKEEFKEFSDNHQVIDLDKYGVEPNVIKQCVHEIQARANQIKLDLEKRG